MSHLLKLIFLYDWDKFTSWNSKWTKLSFLQQPVALGLPERSSEAGSSWRSHATPHASRQKQDVGLESTDTFVFLQREAGSHSLAVLSSAAASAGFLDGAGHCGKLSWQQRRWPRWWWFGQGWICCAQRSVCRETSDWGLHTLVESPLKDIRVCMKFMAQRPHFVSLMKPYFMIYLGSCNQARRDLRCRPELLFNPGGFRLAGHERLGSRCEQSWSVQPGRSTWTQTSLCEV